ncbi:leukocyte immunoglobulin-like receptor subfamily B member 4 isoform 2-T2 [Sarcophilus harrisii]
MAPTLSVLLSLGTFCRPSLWAEPSPFIPVGTNVTLWCRGSARTKRYCLKTPQSSKCSNPSWPSGHGKFLIWPAMKEDAGQYHCYYEGKSQSSHSLELVLTGIHEKPRLQAQPGRSGDTGEDVTLWCRAKSPLDRFALYKDGLASNSTSFEWTSRADFLIPATPGREGTYRCYSFSSDCPHLWSAPSDPLKLSIVDTSLRPGAPDDEAVGPQGPSFVSPSAEGSKEQETTSSASLPPPSSSEAPLGLLERQEGILMGISLFILLLLFLFLFFHCQRWVRLEPRSNEAEDEETLQSSSSAEAMQEQILYMAVKNSRQNRPKKPAKLYYHQDCMPYTARLHILYTRYKQGNQDNLKGKALALRKTRKGFFLKIGFQMNLKGSQRSQEMKCLVAHFQSAQLPTKQTKNLYLIHSFNCYFFLSLFWLL